MDNCPKCGTKKEPIIFVHKRPPIAEIMACLKCLNRAVAAVKDSFDLSDIQQEALEAKA